jgi:hypothetical protein
MCHQLVGGTRLIVEPEKLKLNINNSKSHKAKKLKRLPSLPLLLLLFLLRELWERHHSNKMATMME